MTAQSLRPETNEVAEDEATHILSQKSGGKGRMGNNPLLTITYVNVRCLSYVSGPGFFGLRQVGVNAKGVGDLTKRLVFSP